MKVEFVASVSVIAPEPAVSRQLYVDALGLPLEKQEEGDYYSSEHIAGTKHFGVWPLVDAAQACFGTDEWPSEHAVPQASIEFELADPQAVADGAAELEARGYRLLHGLRTEPWGQSVARMLSPEGAIVGLSYAPWMHDPEPD